MTVNHPQIIEKLKVPPHSIEAEQSVLGSILIKEECFDEVSDFVTANNFYNRSHAMIFENMSEMISKNIRIDLITLSDYLEDKFLLEKCGGMAYIGQLAKNTPSTANAAEYAKIVESRSTVRNLISASYTISDACYNAEGRTTDELLLIAESELTAVSEGTRSAQQDTTIKSGVYKFLDKFEIALQAKGLTGISSGLADLDKKTGGFQNSDLIVIAARPSMGKTTLALNFANHAAKSGKKVMFFSLEMPKDQLVLKMASESGRIPIQALRSPANEYDREGNEVQGVGMNQEYHTNLTNFIGNLNESKMVLDIDDRGGINLVDMKTALKRFQRKYGKVDEVFVDYLQIMTGPKSENKTQTVTEISNGLKRIAKEFDCPVIALSQLNRSLESRTNKRPTNADLRESGAIEQDADVILFVYRDEVYNEQTTDKGLAEIIIGKQRNGPLGTVGTIFQGEFSSFKNLTGRELTSHVQAETKRYEKKKGLEL
jgi:replicative DNA helicase